VAADRRRHHARAGATKHVEADLQVRTAAGLKACNYVPPQGGQHVRVELHLVPLDEIGRDLFAGLDQLRYDLVIPSAVPRPLPAGECPCERRRVPRLIDRVDAGAVFQKHIHGLDLAMKRRNVESRVSIAVALQRRVDVDAAV
jgi:hypothetical protein